MMESNSKFRTEALSFLQNIPFSRSQPSNSNNSTMLQNNNNNGSASTNGGTSRTSMDIQPMYTTVPSSNSTIRNKNSNTSTNFNNNKALPSEQRNNSSNSTKKSTRSIFKAFRFMTGLKLNASSSTTPQLQQQQDMKSPKYQFNSTSPTSATTSVAATNSVTSIAVNSAAANTSGAASPSSSGTEEGGGSSDGKPFAKDETNSTNNTTSSVKQTNFVGKERIPVRKLSAAEEKIERNRNALLFLGHIPMASTRANSSGSKDTSPTNQIPSPKKGNNGTTALEQLITQENSLVTSSVAPNSSQSTITTTLHRINSMNDKNSNSEKGSTQPQGNTTMLARTSLDGYSSKQGLYAKNEFVYRNAIQSNLFHISDMNKFEANIMNKRNSAGLTGSIHSLNSSMEAASSILDHSAYRMHFVTKSKNFPVLSCSYIRPSNNNSKEPKSASTESMHNSFLEEDKENFEHLFAEEAKNYDMSYNPNFLDDPEIRHSKTRKVIKLPGIISSNIPFIKTKALKKELNEQFRERHPDLDKTITLSKIRNMKLRMLELAMSESPCTEVSTIVLAVIYFEKLILRGYIVKSNRKLLAAICVFLAYKFNMEHGSSTRAKATNILLDELEESFNTSRKKILELEFKVFSWLDFELDIHLDQFYPQFKRLLLLKNCTANEYLEEYFSYYFSDLNTPVYKTVYNPASIAVNTM